MDDQQAKKAFEKLQEDYVEEKVTEIFNEDQEDSPIVAKAKALGMPLEPQNKLEPLDVAIQQIEEAIRYSNNASRAFTTAITILRGMKIAEDTHAVPEGSEDVQSNQ